MTTQKTPLAERKDCKGGGDEGADTAEGIDACAQTGRGASDGAGTTRFRGGAQPRDWETDLGKLGEGASSRQAARLRRERGVDSRAVGGPAAARGVGAGDAEARHSGESRGVLCRGPEVKHALIDGPRFVWPVCAPRLCRERGKPPLSAAAVMCSHLPASASLPLAARAADGESLLGRVYPRVSHGFAAMRELKRSCSAWARRCGVWETGVAQAGARPHRKSRSPVCFS